MQELCSLYSSGRPYAFLQHTQPVLESNPRAPELAAMSLRALVEFGYGEPARELLRLRQDLRELTAGNDQLHKAINRLPDGQVSWDDLHNVFKTNVETLLASRPHLSPMVEEGYKRLSNVQLYRSRQGHYHISKPQPRSLRKWLSNPSTSEDDKSTVIPEHGKIPPPAIIGLRTGKLIDLVYERTKDLFLQYSHPLYMFEQDPVMFAAWLHMADHRKLLADERVFLFIGANGLVRFQEILKTHDHLVFPNFFLTLGADPDFAGEVKKISEKECDRRTHEWNDLVAKLKQRYADRDINYWRERWKQPACVMAVTSRYTTTLQFAARDAMTALENLGYKTFTAVEQMDHHQLSDISIARIILENDPAMLFFFDHLRYECEHSPKNIPFLTWVQDPLPNILCRQAGDSIGELDFVCGNLRHRCVTEYGYPADRFVQLDIPVSTAHFHDAKLSEENLAKYQCDVSFVSNSSKPLNEIFKSKLKDFPTAALPLLEAIYARIREMLANNEFPIDYTAAETKKLVDAFGAKLDKEQLEFVTMHFSYRLLDWGRRQQTLEWVGEWARRTGRTFRIYGRGWENHPTLSQFAMGVIEHGEPLRRACLASRICLQLIPSGFRHQRSYEILASGSLPLTRYCNNDYGALPMEEFVEKRDAGLNPPGEKLFSRLERITFRTPEEFEALAERFLADDDYREEVRQDLRRTVLENCTYDSHMRKVMEAFKARLNGFMAGP